MPVRVGESQGPVDVSSQWILVDLENDIIIHSADSEGELLAVAGGFLEEAGDSLQYNLVIYERKAVLE